MDIREQEAALLYEIVFEPRPTNGEYILVQGVQQRPVEIARTSSSLALMHAFAKHVEEEGAFGNPDEMAILTEEEDEEYCPCDTPFPAWLSQLTDIRLQLLLSYLLGDFSPSFSASELLSLPDLMQCFPGFNLVIGWEAGMYEATYALLRRDTRRVRRTAAS